MQIQVFLSYTNSYHFIMIFFPSPRLSALVPFSSSVRYHYRVIRSVAASEATNLKQHWNIFQRFPHFIAVQVNIVNKEIMKRLFSAVYEGYISYAHYFHEPTDFSPSSSLSSPSPTDTPCPACSAIRVQINQSLSRSSPGSLQYSCWFAISHLFHFR